MNHKRMAPLRIVSLITDSNGSCTHKYLWLNTAIITYVGVVLVTYILFLIAPFITLLAMTPLYSIKTYLGLIGAGLLALDLVTNRGLWRGKNCLLLYGICVAAAVSSLTTMSYGIKDNLFDLCWLAIQFALVYSCAYRTDPESMKKMVARLFTVVLVIWLTACMVSIVQYLFRIGYTYIANPLSDNPELSRQGFWKNRLFGVFTGIDYAVYMSLILLIGCVFYSGVARKLPVRISLWCGSVILFLHMVLSGSRSVQVALVIYVFVFVLLLIRKRDPGHQMKKYLIRLVAGACAAVAVIGLWSGTKNLMERVPDLSQLVEQEVQNPTHPDHPDENSPILPDDGETGKNPDTSLDRELDDISNDRFQIWGDYLSMRQDIGLFGLSLSNYNDYISDHHPELYIVQYFAEDYSESAKTDMVYECHNNYLFVFVSTGLLGFACFMVFFVLALIRIMKHMVEHPDMSDGLIALCAIVGVGCVEALFMNSVFLKINAMSFIFWFCLGMLLKLVTDHSGKQPQ